MDFHQLIESLISWIAEYTVIRAVLGFILVFFLPGFLWTLVFFKKLNIIERIGLSFGLSIALVTLSIIAMNVLLGVSITGMHSLIAIIVISVIPLVIYLCRRFIVADRNKKIE